MTGAHPQEFGLGFGGTLTPSEYRDLAVKVEEYGFSVATVFGDLMMQPPILPLATMATVTSRLRLGVGCFTPWTLHPVEMAGQLAYLDLLSQGRCFMGIVRGAWMDQLGIEQKNALAAVADSIEIVSQLLAGVTTGHEGEVFSLAPGTTVNYPVFRPRLPLMVGTWSPRLAELAGRKADEIQVGGCANVDVIPVIREYLKPGIDRAGRSPVDVGIVLTAVTVVDDDRAAARAQARTEVALPFHVIASLDPTVDVDPEVLERMKPLLRSLQIEEAGRLIPDDVLNKFSFCGTPDDLVAQSEEIYAAGAQRIEFDTPFGVTPQRGLELLGTRVLPALRASMGIGIGIGE
jgi:5,10-methylenetetrahydromethanopterin reductase